MPLLVRKITKGKWDRTKRELADINGDVISDLRTTGNTLSFWYVEDEKELSKAILALVSAPQIGKIDKIDIVWIDKQNFLDNGIEIDESDDESNKGDTVVEDLKDTHRNALNLTYDSLGVISKMILEAIDNGKCQRVKDKKIKEIIKEALDKERINKNNCICKKEDCPDKKMSCIQATKNCPNEFWKLLDELF